MVRQSRLVIFHPNKLRLFLLQSLSAIGTHEVQDLTIRITLGPKIGNLFYEGVNPPPPDKTQRRASRLDLSRRSARAGAWQEGQAVGRVWLGLLQ